MKSKERHTIKGWRVFSKGWANTTIRASAGYMTTYLWHMKPMLTTRTQTILKFKQTTKIIPKYQNINTLESRKRSNHGETTYKPQTTSTYVNKKSERDK